MDIVRLSEREFCHCHILSDVQISPPTPEMTLGQWFSSGPQTRRSNITRERVRKVNSPGAAPVATESETLFLRTFRGFWYTFLIWEPLMRSNPSLIHKDDSGTPGCLRTDSDKYSSETPNPDRAVPFSRLSTLHGLLKTSYWPFSMASSWNAK